MGPAPGASLPCRRARAGAARFAALRRSGVDACRGRRTLAYQRAPRPMLPAAPGGLRSRRGRLVALGSAGGAAPEDVTAARAGAGDQEIEDEGSEQLSHGMVPSGRALEYSAIG